MNKTIRLFIILCIMACCCHGAYAQFRYAAVAGPTYSTLSWKQDLVSSKGAVGAQAGIQGEMMFPGIGFGIDLGLIYNMANTEVNLGEKLIWSSEGYGNELIMMHQINIPLHLRFKYTRLQGLEEVFAPFVYGGPDINFTIAHSKCDAMSFAGGNIGLTAGLGAELFTRWQISASYTWGMTYAMKSELLKDFSARSRQWTLRLAYFF